jgi:formamidopyrimidine-DNA glycosylase
MPELPEVETIRRTLSPKLTGKYITGVNVVLPKAIRRVSPVTLTAELTGEEILVVDRRGKYLLLRLSGHKALVFHLRMTGRLLVRDPNDPLAKHTTLILDLNDGLQLRFEDTRKFGTVDLLLDGAPHAMGLLGPEPLDPKWRTDQLIEAAGKKRTSIKAAILNQQVVAGLGNIYADEALFRARIHPERAANSLAEDEWNRLYQSIRDVLTEGIKYRGTTRRDYVDAEGKTGEFQNRLNVYGRKGLPCLVCGNLVIHKRVAGRGTHFCHHCQPRGDES